MPSFAAWLTRQWTRRGPVACALWPLHALMSALVALRRHGYVRGWWPTRTLPVPVVVIGNRVVGGAGKTPTTMAVVQHLRRRGWQPGVLSRGYGRRGASSHEPLVLDARSEDELSAAEVGDECWLIWRHTAAPIGVASRRFDAGEALLKAHPEINILVCDDGLQHLALARQVEVVVFDERGAGNGWLMPAGLLREPIDAPPGPGSAQPALVVYNAARPSTPLEGYLARRSLAPLQRWEDWWAGKPMPARQADAPKVPKALIEAGKERVWAVAGIAQPERFFKPLRQTGLRFQRCPLPDHDPLTTLPWPDTAAHAVLTEKDAVKLTPERLRQQRAGTQVWVAALDVGIDKAFFQALDRRLLELAPSPTATSPATLG